MRRTVTGNYTSTDEINKIKVAQKMKRENGTERRRKVDGMS
jgi:hypothetical protein